MDHKHDHASARSGHSHSHGAHSHAPKVEANNRHIVGIAAVITGLFVGIEIIGGYLSGSLALMADAGHMLTDFAALAMAWGGFWVAQRPATWRHTYGYDRFAILIAFVNGLTLFLVAAWIVWEAFHRLRDPGEVLAGTMLWVAIAGLIVNIAVFAILRQADRNNLNIRGAMLHVLGDLLGSAAAIVAAIIIMLTGWVAADPILSVLVALLILKSAYGLVRESAHILLEGAPERIDTREIAADLMATIPGLIRVEHIHAWSITPERPMLTLEAYIVPEMRLGVANRAIKAQLKSKFEIDHATVDTMRENGAADRILSKSADPCAPGTGE